MDSSSYMSEFKTQQYFTSQKLMRNNCFIQTWQVMNADFKNVFLSSITQDRMVSLNIFINLNKYNEALQKSGKSSGVNRFPGEFYKHPVLLQPNILCNIYIIIYI